MSETVIDKILLLMKSEGVSSSALTSALEISSSSIAEWKKGKAKPSTDAVVKIARYFGVTTDYLLLDGELPLSTKNAITQEEVGVINHCREKIRAGFSYEDIETTMSLSSDAISVAVEWENLDADGQHFIRGKLIEERRRMKEEKKKAPASSDAKAI